MDESTKPAEVLNVGNKMFLQQILAHAMDKKPIAVISDAYDLSLVGPNSKLGIDVANAQKLTGTVYYSNILSQFPETMLRFIKWLGKIKVPFHSIHPEDEDPSLLPNVSRLGLNIASRLTVPSRTTDYAVWWETNREGCFRQLQEQFTGLEGEMVFISAGILSPAIVSYLWRINPHNAYLDQGQLPSDFLQF